MAVGVIRAGFCVVLAAGAAMGADGINATVIYRTGDPAPGEPGLSVGLSSGGVINDAGMIMASYRVTGDGVTSGNNDVLVAGFPGSLVKVARENDPVPGLPGWLYKSGSINLSGFAELVVAPDGSIGFAATLFDTNTNTPNLDGAFAGTTAGVSAAVYETGPAPGFAGNTLFRYEPRLAMRAGGNLAVMGRVMPDAEDVVWFGPPGSLIASLQSGLLAPGILTGATISSFSDGSLRMDATGDIAFAVVLEGSGVNNDNRWLIYEGPPDNLGILARAGDPVPGVPGAVYDFFEDGSIRMSGTGARCFLARTVGGGTDAVLVSCGSGGCFTLAKNGDPVPGIPGATITGLINGRVDLNSAGSVAFSARMSGVPGDADTAVFVGGPGGFQVVLREGDPLPNGEPVSDLSGSLWHFNDRGQFVFELVENDRRAFYATRPNGELVKLARGGEGFAADDGFIGGLASINPWFYDFRARNGGSGGSSVFNASGEFLLSMNFSGSTGSALVLFDIDDPCPADLAEPFDVLNLFDIAAYITLFVAQDPAADLAAPFGAFNFFDVTAYLGLFNAGCPD